MSEYWDEVRRIAQRVYKNFPDPHGAYRKYTCAIVGGVATSDHVFNCAHHERVLEETDNYPDAPSVHDEMTRLDHWKRMRAITARLAMQDDVWDEIGRLRQATKAKEADDE